jgi:hypothetical protein
MKTEWIRLVATPTDKDLLERLQRDNMDDSLSATVRRLIRQEARRRGIGSEPSNETPDDAAAAHAA